LRGCRFAFGFGRWVSFLFPQKYKFSMVWITQFHFTSKRGEEVTNTINNNVQLEHVNIIISIWWCIPIIFLHIDNEEVDPITRRRGVRGTTNENPSNAPSVRNYDIRFGRWNFPVDLLR
jgi:hypothetical protein